MATAEETTRGSEPSPVEVVAGFLGALERLDLERARSFLAAEVSYQNVPLPPVRGPQATIRVLNSFLLLARGFEVELLNIAADGDVVLTERVDTFTNGPFRAGFWVCGTFEVREGKIVLWRDRFDFADLLWSLFKGLALIPVRLRR